MNWNNNGAERISPQVIKRVRKLLMSMTNQPEVFPTASIKVHGTVCHNK